MNHRLIFLGTGSSGGVPRIGNDWGLCDPSEPKNRRTRCSVYVERTNATGAQTRILIDTAPDMREQLLREKIGLLDAVLFTHDHADQAHGIDDLRQIVMRTGRKLPVHLDEATYASLTRRFAYCFSGAEIYPAILEAHNDLRSGRPLSIQGAGGAINFLPFALQHGPVSSLGFRIGRLAYCNDVSQIPPASFELLHDLDIFIVDALRYEPHLSHAHVELALRWIEQLKPKRAILTNLHVTLDYKTLANQLPEHVEPAYDGMMLNFDGEFRNSPSSRS